jgi:hypothetical protein
MKPGSQETNRNAAHAPVIEDPRALEQVKRISEVCVEAMKICTTKIEYPI